MFLYACFVGQLPLTAEADSAVLDTSIDLTPPPPR